MVSGMVSHPEKLLKLVAKAQRKFTNNSFAHDGNGLLSSTTAAFRLLKAYAAGTYRDISLESIGLIVASLIYFVMPIDGLPDFILGLGLTDDAALLAWTFKSVSQDIERFMAWEKENENVE